MSGGLLRGNASLGGRFQEDVPVIRVGRWRGFGGGGLRGTGNAGNDATRDGRGVCWSHEICKSCLWGAFTSRAFHGYGLIERGHLVEKVRKKER